MEIKFRLKDNSDKVIQELENALGNALEEIGLRAEGYAAANAPVGNEDSTGVEKYHGGSLKNSITHKIIDNTVYIGSSLKYQKKDSDKKEYLPYSVYVELGTGVHASKHDGRRSPWAWKDKNGKWHWTRGIKPTHFLKKAIANHQKEYIRVVKKHLNKGE